MDRWGNIYEHTGRQDCYYCKGMGSRTVWNGSIHDPRDPEVVTCPHCNGRGWVIVVDSLNE